MSFASPRKNKSLLLSSPTNNHNNNNNSSSGNNNDMNNNSISSTIAPLNNMNNAVPSSFSFDSPRINSNTAKPKKKMQSLGLLGCVLSSFGVMYLLFLWSRHLVLDGSAYNVSTSTSSSSSSISTSGHHGSTTSAIYTTTTTYSNRVVKFPYETSSTATTTETTTAVFYHVFIPDTPEGRDNSLRIIRQQLQQLQQSSIATKQLTVYYTTVGPLLQGSQELNSAKILSVCQEYSLICHPMEHHEQGMEDLTLQPLHDYCTLHPTNNHHVLYLHNKGSFSTKPLNEAWRYQMTQAISSPQCLDAISSEQCNLCGLYFTAERGLFMAGNMWTSPCSYIQQLLPLEDFHKALHQVTANALLERLRYKFLMTMQELRAGVFGIDRYATEFWVGSHPTIRPCDFSKAVPLIPNKGTDLTDQFLAWLRNAKTDFTFPLDPKWFVLQAPHHRLRFPETSTVAKYQDVRMREYFLLPGNLYKWFALYHEAPPPSSWIYEWFPDGTLWKNALQQYGNQAVDVMTSQALKDEAASQRNKYTADRSINLSSTTTTNANNNKGTTKGTARKMATVKKGGPRTRQRRF